MGVADGAGAVGDPLLASLVVGSIIVAVPLAALSVLAFTRRQTSAYFFVAVAFLAFFGQAFADGVSLLGIVGVRTERLLDAAFDIGIALSFLLAVVLARRANNRSVFSFENK